MKKLLTICLIMLCAFIIKAQTGNGIVAQINSPYAFTPTTVDSTTTIDVVFVNTVGAQQTLTFTGIAAPFSISSNSVLIGASDSTTIQLSFNPTVVGNFSDTLDFSGSIFGSGSLVVNSEGVQVSITTSTDSLNLGSISLGTSVTDSFMISNSGTGTMAISNISSNNTDFTVSPTSATIAQGASMYVSITYTPVLSGLSTATIAIASNDPNNPIYNVFVEGSAVSEISGALCGTTLSLINSPYTLTGDITVADSCTLIIEPGVILNCAQYNLLIDGRLQAIGTASDSIIINDFVKINLHNSTSNDSISFVKFDSDDSYISLSNQDNSLNNCFVNTAALVNGYESGVFDFEDGQWPKGWSNTGSFSVSSSSGNPGYGIYADVYDYSKELLTSYYAVNANQVFSCDYRRIRMDYYCYPKFYYRINNGSWVQFWQGTGHNAGSGSWETITYTIPSNVGDLVQIKFLAHVHSAGSTNSQYDESRFHLDNIQFGETQMSIIKSETAINYCIINGHINTTNDVIINNSTLTVTNLNSITSSRGNITINNSTISGGTQQVIYSFDDNINVSLFNTSIKDSDGHGIYTIGDNSEVSLQYSFIKDNDGIGVYTTGSGSHVNLSSSMVSDNGSYGIQSSGQVNSNYSNITFNEDDGVYLTGNNFSNIKNSIIWGNDIINYNQINTSSGVTSITYSTVQGSGAYGTTGGQYYFGDGSIDDDPVFADSEQHMSSFSNCVDAGTPWEVDANMPYGLGGVRADIGIYGGPDNWFWGGTPVPDGSPLITSIEDSPQDQGGIAGILFDASVWDNSTLVNNVTHYSIWRNYDISGATVDSVNEGNWQMMGSMQAQSFSAYAYEAATLGDSSIANGMFNNCYVVVAHTGDSATYWYSNVLCGYSTDDMAPSAPIASAMAVANTDDVVVYWDAPAVNDYAYSNVISTNGFTSLGVVDTMTLDVSTLSGGTYTYGVVHFDVNGNASDTAWVTITLADNEDVIPLTAGWNLISTNKSPNNNDMTNIFSSLMPGNLVYVTAFNQGSSLYNPNGLPFLNTLTQFTDGYGYWVKVLVDDTLSISGTTIPATYKIPLNANWNLSGYMSTTAEAPSSYLGTLIANNNLVYCTGFNQGTLLFNPNGLPFLNTLNSMQRPFGYWIKVNNAVGAGNYRMANNEGAKFSPEFMFVNGTSNLESHVGSFVDVLNSANELVAKLEIVNGGYLMTTALYGDDPTTEMIEGLQEGEYLTFKFNGEEIYSSVSFNGNMELKTIDLEFSNDGAWSIYPNPLSTTTTINYQLNTTAHVSIKVFDIAGRQIDELVNVRQDASYYTQIWDATNFEKGVYMMELHINGTKITTERLIVQ